MFILQILAIVASGILDRLRGSGASIPGGKNTAKVLLGYAMAVVAGFPLDPIITPAIMVAMVIGMSFGWGAPMGAIINNVPMNQNDLEWWQVGIMKTNPWTALVGRGVLWGGLVALVAFLGAPSLLWFIPAYAIAFPISIILGPKFGPKLGELDVWAATEYARGWLAALIVFIGTLF